MSVLTGVKPFILVNAGHHLKDNGASHNDVIEAVECMRVRDELVPVLKERGYTVEVVPDHLTLADSIKHVNQKAPMLNDGLAIDIHFNFSSSDSVRGTEAFFGTSATSKKIAEAMSRRLAKSLGTTNRGAKPDTMTAVGSLGWIRNTKTWATLIEVCFLSNEKDMQLLKTDNGYKKAAIGIADAVDELFGAQPVVINNTSVEPSVRPSLASFTTQELVTEIAKRMVGKGK